MLQPTMSRLLLVLLSIISSLSPQIPGLNLLGLSGSMLRLSEQEEVAEEGKVVLQAVLETVALELEAEQEFVH